jgi:heme-binding protein
LIRAATAIVAANLINWMKEPTMLLLARVSHWAVAGVFAAGVLTSTLCATAGTAVAEPSGAPNCTAADVAGVAGGVATALSAYLYTHPDTNAFYTGLQGEPQDQMRMDVQNYMNANPQVQAELQGIRQPLTDIRERCQWTPLLGQAGATP